jgi:hypothetical protein
MGAKKLFLFSVFTVIGFQFNIIMLSGGFGGKEEVTMNMSMIEIEERRYCVLLSQS